MTSTPAIDVPVIDTDPYSDEVLMDPHGFYEELREAGPVAWLSAHGVYATGRYEEVRHVMSSNDIFISGRGVGLEDIDAPGRFRPPSVILEADGESHARIRKAFMSVLSLRASWSDQIDAIVAAAIVRPDPDLVRDLAIRIPVDVLTAEVGFTGDHVDDLVPYGEAVFNVMGSSNARQREALRQGSVYQPWVTNNCQRDALRPGSLGAAIWELVDRGEVAEAEAALLVRTFYAAGVDSSVSALSNTLQALAAAPEEWAKIHADPSLARLAAEECLRYTSVVQQFYRTAVADTDVGGIVLPAGSRIGAWMGSANHDPRKWGEDAAKLDITRQASGQIAFGMGGHQCAGMGLARLQLESALTSLATRVKEITPVAEPEPRLNNTVRSWRAVPVQFPLA